MDRHEAALLLRSLLERVETDPHSGRLTLGKISSSERSAMEFALVGLTDRDASETDVSHAAGPETLEARASARGGEAPVPMRTTTDRRSLDIGRTQDEAILLCLDFGTAMSKAFATRSNASDHETFESMPLELGRRAGYGVYPVESSFWIGDDGHLFAGRRAVALSIQQDPEAKRTRFDSLKRELTLGDTDTSPDETLLRSEFNPTRVPLTQGDAITFYLAYLTDLACSELEETYGVSRYVRRRFALPSWSAERRTWGEQRLATMLARAQIVADTFRGRWDEGVPIGEAKAVLESVRTLPNLPTYLIGEGVSEPLAAGASRLRRDENARGLAMVVDVGAGTTDFALFYVSEDPSRKIFNAWPISGCTDALAAAGDALDGALLAMVRQQARLDPNDPEFRNVFGHMLRNARSWKESVFRDGVATFTLLNGTRATVSRDEFLARPEVEAFSDKVAVKFKETLHRAHRSFPERLAPQGLNVVLTGGGSTLPMLRSLAIGESVLEEFTLVHRGVPLVPEAFEQDANIRAAYPQLAVAIGGAIPSMMGEGDSLSVMPGRSVQRWSLESVPTRGQ